VCKHPVSWQRIVVDQEATCTKDGVKKVRCDMCNRTVTTNYDATGHTFQVMYKKDSTCSSLGYTEYKCLICSEIYYEGIGMLDHDFSDEGYCINCDIYKDDVKYDDEE
jgi:hypothetical protein